MAKKLSRRQQRLSKYAFKPTEPMQTFKFMFGLEGFKAQKKMWEDAFNAHIGKNKKKS